MVAIRYHGSGLGLPSCEAVLLDEAVETGPGNPQNLRNLTLHSPGSAENPLNVGSLNGLQGVISGLEGLDTVLPLFRLFEGEVLYVDDGTPAEDDGPGQRVLQLSNVPWPIVRGETVQRFLG